MIWFLLIINFVEILDFSNVSKILNVSYHGNNEIYLLSFIYPNLQAIFCKRRHTLIMIYSIHYSMRNYFNWIQQRFLFSNILILANSLKVMNSSNFPSTIDWTDAITHCILIHCILILTLTLTLTLYLRTYVPCWKSNMTSYTLI